MTEQEQDFVKKLTKITNDILSGKSKIKVDLSDIEGITDVNLRNLADSVTQLGGQYRDSYRFILDLSNGRLETDPPQHNAFANPFKQLHSDLRHLTWQIQEIANGDYDQCVSFSGDFSESINKMIEALRERQVLNAKLLENEHLFRSIFSTSPDGIALCDLDHNVMKMSNAAMQMLQINDLDLRQGLNFINMLDPADRQTGRWFLQSLQQQGSSAMCTELRIKPKYETSFWSEHNASVLYDLDGQPKGYIVIFRDISERKAAEQQLLQFTQDLDESNKTKDKLFSIIAHDLKNPFNALLGFSDLLMKEADNDKANLDVIRKFAKILNDSSAKAFDLLTNLLEWSRIQSNRIVVKPEPLDLNEVIDFNIGIASTTALEKEITVTMTNPGCYPVTSDRAIINTIMRNLLGNAVKYTANNGKIEVTVNTIEQGNYQISVKDNGVGIKSDALAKIFNMETVHSTPGTNNEKGTGLGLILCKDFISKIGGEIHAESVYGHGTTFTFTVKDIQ